MPGLRPVPRHPGGWHQTRYAGFWRRALALVIDVVILAVVGVAVLLVADLMLVGLGRLVGAPADDVARLRGLAGWIINAVLGVLYFATLESAPAQATPGKRAIGIFVGDQDGERIGLVQALMRNGAKGLWATAVGWAVVAYQGIDIDSEAGMKKIVANSGAMVVIFGVGSLGHVMAAWTSHKQALHDVITGCYVLRR